MLQRIQNLEKAVRYIASNLSVLANVDKMLKEVSLPKNFGKLEDEINSALIKGGFKDYEIKQLEQILRYTLHRLSAHNYCGLTKGGIGKKEVNKLLEKIK